MAYTQADLIGVSLAFPILGFLLVGVRFWMRRYFQKVPIGIDDGMILFASVLVIGMGVDAILGTYLGTMGMDGQVMIASRVQMQNKLDYITLVMEKPAYGAIKLSVLFFYRRIFVVGTIRTVNNCLIALIVVWTLAFWLGDILNCGAYPNANWNPAVKAKTTCTNLYEMLLVFAVSDVVTDAAIMWIPYPQVKRLSLDKKERWTLAGIFLLGTLDLLVGIVRLGFIIANQTIPAVHTNFNPPNSTAPTFWTVVEVGVGVIAANLPALAPLFRHRAKLGLLLSSYRERLLSRSGGPSTSTRTDSITVDTVTMRSRGLSHGGEEVLMMNAKASTEKEKERVDSVGAWDQFRKMDELSAMESGTEASMSSTTL